MYNKGKHICTWGGGGVLALMSNPGEQKFQDSKTSSQSRHMYDKGKNNCQFFKYGPKYTNMCIFGYSGGGGGWVAHK